MTAINILTFTNTFIFAPNSPQIMTAIDFLLLFIRTSLHLPRIPATLMYRTLSVSVKRSRILLVEELKKKKKKKERSLESYTDSFGSDSNDLQDSPMLRRSRHER